MSVPPLPWPVQILKKLREVNEDLPVVICEHLDSSPLRHKYVGQLNKWMWMEDYEALHKDSDPAAGTILFSKIHDFPDGLIRNPNVMYTKHTGTNEERKVRLNLQILEDVLFSTSLS